LLLLLQKPQYGRITGLLHLLISAGDLSMPEACFWRGRIFRDLRIDGPDITGVCRFNSTFAWMNSFALKGIRYKLHKNVAIKIEQKYFFIAKHNICTFGLGPQVRIGLRPNYGREKGKL